MHNVDISDNVKKFQIPQKTFIYDYMLILKTLVVIIHTLDIIYL